MVLEDNFGRKVTNLRLSITPRCNLDCFYCHAEGEVQPREELSLEEIQEILRVGAKFGIRSVKLTGGEPLVRKDILDIVRAIPDGIEASLTTNGTLLEGLAHDLKAAGLSRVNVSLDTLRPERYRAITKRDLLDRVVRGIKAAVDAGLTPVKLNMVLLKDVNEDETEDFFAFVRGNDDLILQVIELMEFNECTLHGDVDGLEKEIAENSKEIITRRMHHRKKYCLNGAEVEVVRPLHNTEFCAYCNRLRVTSDGFLKPCLLRTDNHIDIRGKHGKELEDLFVKAVQIREPFFK
ncbi:MAG: GTP 3',8-cyclase MoaA [Methanofollis sp.]|nr:GTP 3',8-cyclase MoaA [Methanofollis sp.]